MGPMSDQPARSERLRLSLTPGQLAFLKRQAAQRKLPTAIFAHRLLIEALRKLVP